MERARAARRSYAAKDRPPIRARSPLDLPSSENELLSTALPGRFRHELAARHGPIRRVSRARFRFPKGSDHPSIDATVPSSLPLTIQVDPFAPSSASKATLHNTLP